MNAAGRSDFWFHCVSSKSLVLAEFVHSHDCGEENLRKGGCREIPNYCNEKYCEKWHRSYLECRECLPWWSSCRGLWWLCFWGMQGLSKLAMGSHTSSWSSLLCECSVLVSTSPSLVCLHTLRQYSVPSAKILILTKSSSLLTPKKTYPVIYSQHFWHHRMLLTKIKISKKKYFFQIVINTSSSIPLELVSRLSTFPPISCSVMLAFSVWLFWN